MTIQDNMKKLTRADFASDQEVRWCPGCGDYSILACMQRLLPEFGIPPEQTVFISGIGCSGRFPYYMNTYGFHTIHGRAPTIATGLKIMNPELSIWLITGDGDGLSIGGNHLMHILRRNLDINILLFNNEIYGLTKGQFSPTSELGKVTNTSPRGNVDYPINPLAFALASEATFVARALDVDVKGLQAILRAAVAHKGTSFVEIYQNCNIFNDLAFAEFAAKPVRADRTVQLETGKPIIFGAKGDKGIRCRGMELEVVDLAADGNVYEGNSQGIISGYQAHSDMSERRGHDGMSKNQESRDGILIHSIDNKHSQLAYLLANMSYPEFPVPFGIFRAVERPCYDELLAERAKIAANTITSNSLKDIWHSGLTWVVE